MQLISISFLRFKSKKGKWRTTSRTVQLEENTLPSQKECHHAGHTNQQEVFYASQMMLDLRAQPAYVTDNSHKYDLINYINLSVNSCALNNFNKIKNKNKNSINKIAVNSRKFTKGSSRHCWICLDCSKWENIIVWRHHIILRNILYCTNDSNRELHVRTKKMKWVITNTDNHVFEKNVRFDD